MSKEEIRIKDENEEFDYQEVHNLSNKKSHDPPICEVKIEETIHKYDKDESKIGIKQNPYFCATCFIDYEEKNTFFVHILTHHEGKKPRKCKLCEYPLSSKQSLKKHMRIIHGEMQDDVNLENDNGFHDIEPFAEKIESYNDFCEVDDFSENLFEKEESDEDYTPGNENAVKDELGENTETLDEVQSNEIEWVLD
jgi:hypothetical protein